MVPEVFIPLEEAARLESVGYDTIKKRIQRAPERFNTQFSLPDSGGRERVLVALSSLTATARKAYKAAQRVDGAAIATEGRAAGEAPWYVEVDLNWYIEGHRQEYLQMVELADKVQEFLAYADGRERTAYANEFATELGISQRTLYRYGEAVLEASAWALRMEQDTGYGYEYYQALALCRKPKDVNTFPSLPPEQRALIENIWFNKDFARNHGTVEMLYDAFEIEAHKRGWAEWPSVKTVGRYVKYLEEKKCGATVRHWAANGTREWKNEKMLKGQRDTRYLEVMGIVQADAHTFDCWVQITQSNGKVAAVRPMMVAFIDIKSRRILGDVMCVTSNMQTVKQALLKLVYQDAGSVPKMLMIDNGKDFTGKDMTGQDRNEHEFQLMCDAEFEGFYRSMGIQRWHRSKPFQPYDKAYIERSFGTVCRKFVRWMGSYTGTLTGSTTEAKVKKDIPKLLERGKLLTMEEFYAQWTYWKTEKYEQRQHGGLKAAGETYTTPAAMWEHGPRYFKAAPPWEMAQVLLMRSEIAAVTNQGIRRWNTLFTASELGPYIGQKVGIKYDPNDMARLHVYDKDGNKICVATSAELLKFEPELCQKELTEHMHRQAQQFKLVREAQAYYTTPYEARQPDPNRTPAVVSSLNLAIEGKGQKAIALPTDKEARAEIRQAARRKSSNDYFIAKAQDAIKKLEEIG